MADAVLAKTIRAAEESGHPSRDWLVITPRNANVRARGTRIDRVIAIDMTARQVSDMLAHPSVSPAWATHGLPEVIHVRTSEEPQ